ncbi:MAG: PepSY domain-containing protein [Candidatus Xenobia bacterium]
MKSWYSVIAIGITTMTLAAVPVLAAPKMTAAQARQVVLARYPHSKIVGKVSYENEERGWEYSVTIQSGQTLREVMVDANTGKIVSVENTNPAEEQREGLQKGK